MPVGPSDTAAFASAWLMEIKLWDILLDLLYPTRCIFCHKFLSPGRPRICPVCEERLPYTENGGRRRGDFFAECVSALYYENDVREAVHRFKFHGVQAYADVFGELTASCIYENLTGEYDILSWVPLDPRRRRKRGYDQTELIARAVGKRLCRKPEPVLRKRRGVHPQSETGAPEARKANIAGAYRVIDRAQVAGKRILLIDDIVTTGSTLSECAKTLLLAGAEEVRCATLASTR